MLFSVVFHDLLVATGSEFFTTSIIHGGLVDMLPKKSEPKPEVIPAKVKTYNTTVNPQVLRLCALGILATGCIGTIFVFGVHPAYALLGVAVIPGYYSMAKEVVSGEADEYIADHEPEILIVTAMLVSIGILFVLWNRDINNKAAREDALQLERELLVKKLRAMRKSIQQKRAHVNGWYETTIYSKLSIVDSMDNTIIMDHLNLFV